MTSHDLSNLDIWFKVFHPEFNPELVYKGLAIFEYGETAWAQILFCNERGMMYTVINKKCLCVTPESFYKSATEEQKKLKPAKPKGKNPDIEEIDL